MRHGRRQRDFGDLPWVTIAVIVGVIAVAGIAVFFFMGGGSGHASSTTSTGSTGSSSASPASSVLSPIDASMITVKETTQAPVPSDGTYVQVTYIGGFSGSYGVDGALVKTQDSGSRVYPVESASGTVRAQFKKLDGSTKHDLTVQIWKDGKAVKYATNSSPYGTISIQYP